MGFWASPRRFHFDQKTDYREGGAWRGVLRDDNADELAGGRGNLKRRAGPVAVGNLGKWLVGEG